MPVSIFWFRRDLRLQDNAGLYHALKSGQPVMPIFIFDTNILDKLVERADARVQFIHDSISALRNELQALGSDLCVYHGDPTQIWKEILATHNVAEVYSNHDYEPYALTRDAAISNMLDAQKIAFKSYKDHVIFEKKEVTKDDGLPYTVFSPYSRKWRALLDSKMVNVKRADGQITQISYYLKAYPTERYFQHFNKFSNENPTPSLADMGFEPSDIVIPSKLVARSLIKDYANTRNFPAIAGTSRLGIHFRFGTISVREKVRNAMSLSDIFVNELIWRDFYAMIMSNFPHVIGAAFRPAYDGIAWRDDEKAFELWCEGKTGYPIVDAGMRELNTTGNMHNRVRMIVASFLTKHLLIDWRLGEQYFAQKLLDFELASNNGGWQWAMGGGTDAAPYFRVFNPTAQQEKFDAQSVYIRRWVKEYGTADYPKPIVEHKFARERCLETYKAALKGDS